MRKDRMLAAAAALLAGVLNAAPAAAQEYPPPAPPGPAVLGTSFERPAVGGTSTAARTAPRTLPRTGYDVAAIAVAGGGVLAAGVVVFALGRRHRKA